MQESGPAGKSLLGAAAVGGNDRMSRHHFVESARTCCRFDSLEPGRERFSHAVFEAALVVPTVPNVSETLRV
jgi:hypothetical protein